MVDGFSLGERGSCQHISDLGSEVPEHHFHCTLLIKASHKASPESGRGSSFYFLMGGAHTQGEMNEQWLSLQTPYHRDKKGTDEGHPCLLVR